MTVERGWEVRDARNSRRVGTVAAISETKSMHADGNRYVYSFFIEWDDGDSGWVGESDVLITGRKDTPFPPVSRL